MQSNTIQQQAKPIANGGGDAFDLDISVLESGDGAATLINLTDDGCGSSCPNACATNIG
ncbi:FxLD family lanthipeptide [Streptomyces chartreusis]|uniref:FxLD family lantipeptide n=1 Tax=Streptomyces chartreusis TaxID=1969 RepID=A0A7H8TBJ4_STRCX|nr:FxLD family lanthipeptide [Streptomyces chartreusis]QKZ20368.1 FxLD family lantipeptide [Streptomyces chartreusis]